MASRSRGLLYQKKVNRLVARFGSTVIRTRQQYLDDNTTITKQVVTYTAISVSEASSEVKRVMEMGLYNSADPQPFLLVFDSDADVQETDTLFFDDKFWKVVSVDPFTLQDVRAYTTARCVKERVDPR